MKKQALICIIVCTFGGIAVASDIAISTQANWWTQDAADRETQEIADAVTSASVELFPEDQQAALADWVIAHTGNGRVDLLMLCGQCPDTIYPEGNTQPDGSLLELFLDDGNCVINTGDWMFYFVNGAGANGAAAMVNIMDLDTMTERWDDNTEVTVTPEGRLYCPSLVDFLTDRALHMDLLDENWDAELSLALATDGARADPGIVRNNVTGGRIGVFYEVADEDDLPRGEVISEWINNWFLPTLFQMADPAPANTAVDVPRYTDLSWTVWGEAVAHDVYFGTDSDDVQNATRENPLGVLVSQGQTETTYDLPGLLDWGATYYWRVDAVAADATIAKGEVLSFTVELFAPAIEGIVVTSNITSPDDTQLPENLVNGSGLNDNGEHSTDTTKMWLGDPRDDEPMYIQFEFKRVHKMYSMDVWNHNFIFEMALGLGLKDVTVQYSADGAEWTILKDVQLAQAPGLPTYTANTTVDLEGVAAKFVRLVINSNYGGSQYGLSEVRFLHIPVAASHPDPADGATDVSVATPLSWRRGREAVSHDVSLGTDPEALAMVGTTTQFSLETLLDLETTYYWRVDEVNNGEAIATWSGDVWSFTTEEYIMLDDFESYTDDSDADKAIWQTWVDGLEDDSVYGGSMVGNDPSPFAEQTIVYEGGQSMPLYYDNVAYTFSETTRTFSPAQDWSQHGITTLVVRFKGDISYSAAQKLYVKINGTKVVYAGDVTAPIWQTYNVDLTSVNTNLSSVKTLTIGIDGTGQGVLYVDAIALYATPPQAPPAAGDKSLVAHWKLDETSGLIAADSSGYGNDGTLVGMEETQWMTGINGGALEFAGTAANPQWVDCGTPKSLELADSVTMAAWVKMNEGNDGVYMGIGGRLNTTPYVGFALVRHSSNVFRLWANSATNELAGFDASSDVTYTDTEWHHVAGVVDDGAAMLYVDGVKQAIESSVALQVSPGIFCLGKQYNVGANHRYWNGLMDDVRVYYRALSAQEIAGL